MRAPAVGRAHALDILARPLETGTEPLVETLARLVVDEICAPDRRGAAVAAQAPPHPRGNGQNSPECRGGPADQIRKTAPGCGDRVLEAAALPGEALQGVALGHREGERIELWSPEAWNGGQRMRIREIGLGVFGEIAAQRPDALALDAGYHNAAIGKPVRDGEPAHPGGFHDGEAMTARTVSPVRSPVVACAMK
ncbi:hypothetical protein C8J28_104247, partial [Cereibacter azotoformans]